VWGWVNEKGVWSFDEMTDIPLNLRKLLNDYFKIGSLTVVAQQVYEGEERVENHEELFFFPFFQINEVKTCFATWDSFFVAQILLKPSVYILCI
jgi:hypothetical protein